MLVGKFHDKVDIVSHLDDTRSIFKIVFAGENINTHVGSDTALHQRSKERFSCLGFVKMHIEHHDSLSVRCHEHCWRQCVKASELRRGRITFVKR